MLQLLPLISSFFVFLLGVVVWYKNRTEKLNNVFLLTCLAVGVWFFSSYKLFTTLNLQAIYFWGRFMYVGVVFLPALLYHLAVIFAHVDKARKKIIYGAYFISLIFLFLTRTKYFLDGIYFYTTGIHLRAQLFFNFFLVVSAFFLLLFFRELYAYYQRSKSPIVKNQTKYIIISFYILSFSVLEFLPAFGIAVYPVFYLLGVVFSVVCAYAILRYRLLSPRFIVSRSLIYFFLVLFVAVTFSFLMVLVSGGYLQNLNYTNRLLLTLVVAFLVVLSLEPLKNFLAVTTDRVFFKNRIDYDVVLDELSHIINEEINLQKLIDNFCNKIKEKMRFETFNIGLCRPHQDKLTFYLDGQKATKKIFHLHNLDSLINYFKENPRALVVEEFGHHFKEIEKDITKQKEFKKEIHLVFDELQKLKSEAVVPVFKDGNLTALMVSGRKLSGDAYHAKDLAVLNVLATQFASALEKARLFEEAERFSKRLKKEVEHATKDLRDANEHLQELDRSKTEFISIASHQLRTPLSGIKGYLSMLLEGDFGQMAEDQRKVVTNILSNADRLVRLVNIFLNISRIESGKLKLEKSQFDIVNLVEEVVGQLKTDAEEKNLAIVFKDHPSILQVLADRDKIYDVISNLLDNSIKYTTAGKIIVKMEINKAKNLVEISIADTGIGIPPDELDELFIKFRRGKKIAQINTSGSGLGLFIAKKIVELHDGDIWARSKGEGKGSEFGFEIPLH